MSIYRWTDKQDVVRDVPGYNPSRYNKACSLKGDNTASPRGQPSQDASVVSGFI